MRKEEMEQQLMALFKEVKKQGSFNGVVLVAVGEAVGIAGYNDGGVRHLNSEDGKGMRLVWYAEDEPEVAERLGC